MIYERELKELMNYDPETGLFTRKTAAHGKSIGGKVGCVKPSGYVQMRVNNKYYYAHRLAWLYVYGSMPSEIDHVNGDKSDNRIDNLRLCTSSQNRMNLVQRNNKWGYPGVGLDNVTGKWLARVKFENARIHLGSYDTKEIAASVSEAYREKYFGEFLKRDGNVTDEMLEGGRVMLSLYETVGTKKNSSKRNLAMALSSGRAYYCGIQMYKNGTWQARCWLDGKRISLGDFKTKEQADAMANLFKPKQEATYG